MSIFACKLSGGCNAPQVCVGELGCQKLANPDEPQPETRDQRLDTNVGKWLASHGILKPLREADHG